MINEILSQSESQNVPIGFVAEFHAVNDGEIACLIVRPVQEFIEDWGYALLDRNWNETVYDSELPAANPRAAYVGCVHEDGAFLVELNSLVVRQ